MQSNHSPGTKISLLERRGEGGAAGRGVPRGGGAGGVHLLDTDLTNLLQKIFPLAKGSV